MRLHERVPLYSSYRAFRPTLVSSTRLSWSLLPSLFEPSSIRLLNPAIREHNIQTGGGGNTGTNTSISAFICVAVCAPPDSLVAEWVLMHSEQRTMPMPMPMPEPSPGPAPAPSQQSPFLWEPLLNTFPTHVPLLPGDQQDRRRPPAPGPAAPGLLPLRPSLRLFSAASLIARPPELLGYLSRLYSPNPPDAAPFLAPFLPPPRQAPPVQSPTSSAPELLP